MKRNTIILILSLLLLWTVITLIWQPAPQPITIEKPVTIEDYKIATVIVEKPIIITHTYPFTIEKTNIVTHTVVIKHTTMITKLVTPIPTPNHLPGTGM